MSTALNKNIKLSDFPMFNGQIRNWVMFFIEFTSAALIYKFGDLFKENKKVIFFIEFTSSALIYKFGDLFKENKNHISQFEKDSNYKDKCRILYNLLSKSCARGDTYPKIKKHETTKDGYGAWQELYKFYFVKGNIESLCNQ